jgi:hypothetical protein
MLTPHDVCRSVAHDAAKMHVLDGLLPEWLVYHELAETGRSTLRKVCAVERQWLGATLTRLRNLDTKKLSGKQPAPSIAEVHDVSPVEAVKAVQKSASSGANISAAKARALARRAASTAAKKGK